MVTKGGRQKTWANSGQQSEKASYCANWLRSLVTNPTGQIGGYEEAASRTIFVTSSELWSHSLFRLSHIKRPVQFSMEFSQKKGGKSTINENLGTKVSIHVPAFSSTPVQVGIFVESRSGYF